MAMARMTSNEQWWHWRDTPEPQQQNILNMMNV